MTQSDESSGSVSGSASGSTESRMQKAKAAIESKVHDTIKAAAEAFNVKYCTLYNRVKGKHKAARHAHTKQQLLSKTQTENLIEWCKHQALLGEPYTRETLTQQVVQITKGRVPGQKWVSRFLKKHADQLEAGKGRGLDPKRAKAFSKDVVTKHFQILQKTLTEHDIPPENIYNQDETGLQMGGGRKSLGTQFIFPRGLKQKMFKRSDNLQNMTALEAVCADGTALPTFLVLPNGSKPHSWWANEENGLGGITTTPTGWTNNEVYHKWFMDVFLPYAVKNNVSNKLILLISDGHKSHETPELVKAAEKNKVILYSLPPHTTDRLQPLDVSVFEPVQKAWARKSQTAAAQSIPFTPETAVDAYLKLRKETITKKLVLSSFKATGIHPFNDQLFTDEDFAASLIWTLEGSAPKGYPYVPSSAEEAETTEGGSSDWTEPDTGEAEGSKSPETQPAPVDLGLDVRPRPAIDLTHSGSDEDDEDDPDDEDYMSMADSDGDVHMQEDPTVSIGVSSTGSPAQIHPSQANAPAPPPSTATSTSVSGDVAAPGQALTPGVYNLGASDLPIRSHSHRTRSVTREMLKPYSRSTSDRKRPASNPNPSVPSLHSSAGASSNQLRMYEEELAREREDHAATKVALEEAQKLVAAANYRADQLAEQLGGAESHATIQKYHTDHYRNALLAKKERKQGGTVNIHARILTCAEGRVEWERQQREAEVREAQAQAKAKDKEESERKKAKKRREDAVLRVYDMPARYYKNKDDLRGLALALDLNDDGTRADLATRIATYMDAHPERAREPRFTVLYAKEKPKKKRVRGSRHTSVAGPSTSGTSSSRAPDPTPANMRLRSSASGHEDSASDHEGSNEEVASSEASDEPADEAAPSAPSAHPFPSVHLGIGVRAPLNAPGTWQKLTNRRPVHVSTVSTPGGYPHVPSHAPSHAPPHAPSHASSHAPSHAGSHAHAPPHASSYAPPHASPHAPPRAAPHAPPHAPSHGPTYASSYMPSHAPPHVPSHAHAPSYAPAPSHATEYLLEYPPSQPSSYPPSHAVSYGQTGAYARAPSQGHTGGYALATSPVLSYAPQPTASHGHPDTHAVWHGQTGAYARAPSQGHTGGYVHAASPDLSYALQHAASSGRSDAYAHRPARNVAYRHPSQVQTDAYAHVSSPPHAHAPTPPPAIWNAPQSTEASGMAMFTPLANTDQGGEFAPASAFAPFAIGPFTAGPSATHSDSGAFSGGYTHADEEITSYGYPRPF